jgi:hypothetical protein
MGKKVVVKDGPTSKEKVEAAQKQLVAHIESMVTSEDWTAFLKLAAKFPKYSANNCWLIQAQCPNATRVAGFNTWKDLGRFVKKDEKAIKILGPVRVRLNKDEPEDEAVFGIRGFRVVSVFDISQTEGTDIEDGHLTSLLEGEAPDGMWGDLTTLCEKEGYKVSYGDTGEANGFIDPTNMKIVVSALLSDAASVQTLAHELAHARQLVSGRTNTSREVKEIEAESVAYVVCEAFGISSVPYSIGYVAGWAHGDTEAVRKTADWVVKTAHSIITDVSNIVQPEDELVTA